jgi:hypothetical protein
MIKYPSGPSRSRISGRKAGIASCQTLPTGHLPPTKNTGNTARPSVRLSSRRGRSTELTPRSASKLFHGPRGSKAPAGGPAHSKRSKLRRSLWPAALEPLYPEERRRFKSPDLICGICGICGFSSSAGLQRQNSATVTLRLVLDSSNYASSFSFFPRWRKVLRQPVDDVGTQVHSAAL